MSTTPTEIGRRIREIRRARKISQRNLAAQIGMQYSAPLCDVERGKHYPGVPTVLAICEALKCTPNDLLGYADAAIRAENAEKRIEKIREIITAE